MGQICCIFLWRNLTNTSKENTIFKTKLPHRKENKNEEGRTPPNPNPQIQEQHDTSQTGKQHTQFPEKPQHHVTKIPNELWNQPINDTASVPPRLNTRRIVALEKSGRLTSGDDSWAPQIPTIHLGYADLPLANTPRQQILSENGPPKPPRQLVSSSEELSRQQICDISSACQIPASRYTRSSMELQQPPKRNTVYAQGPPKPPRLFTYDAETPARQRIYDGLPKPPIPPRQYNVRVTTIQHVYAPPVPPRDFSRSNLSLQTSPGHLQQDISSLLLYRPKGELTPIEEDRELNNNSSLAP